MASRTSAAKKTDEAASTRTTVRSAQTKATSTKSDAEPRRLRRVAKAPAKATAAKTAAPRSP